MPTTLATPPSPPKTVTDRLGLVYPGQTALLAELSGTPQTIGGGPKCTIRLDGAGLRPLHCVVTPSGASQVVRRWAPGTQLNGLDFTEAALSVGDLLRVGSIDLQVIALPIEPGEAEAQPATSSDSTPEALQPPPANPSLESETAPDPVVSDIDSDIDANIDTAETEQPAHGSLDWVDDSVSEVEQAIAQAAEATTEGEAAIDPAIPSHLLQPWQPADGSPPPTSRDTAFSIVELNPIKAEESVVGSQIVSTPPVAEPEAPPIESSTPAIEAPPEAPEPAEEEPAGDVAEPAAADLWAVPQASGAAESESPAIDATSASAWEAEFIQPTHDTHEPEPVALGAADPEAIAAFATEASAVVEPSRPETASSVREVADAQPAPVVESTGSVWATARRAADRARVSRLVATLREHRGRLAAFEAAIAERDEIIQGSQAELAAAVDAADRASEELARLVETTDRLQASEAELAQAQQRIAELEARLADLESHAVAVDEEPGVTPDAMESVVPEQAAAEPVEPTPAPAALPDIATADPVEAVQLDPAEEPVEDSPEAVANLWDTPVAAADPAAEDAWGIEQLSPEPVAEPAALWGAVDEASGFGAVEPEPMLEEAAEPVAAGLTEPESSVADLQPTLEVTEATEATEATIPSDPPSDPPSDLTDWEQVALPSESTTVEPALAAAEQPVSEPISEDAEPSLAVQELFGEASDEVAQEAPVPLAAFQPKPAEPADGETAAPASFIEQYAHMLPDEDESSEPLAPIEPAPMAAVMEPATSEPGEDESIDDYMRKLMQRVRGDSDSEPAPSAIEVSRPTAAVAEAQAAAPTSEPAPVAPTIEPMKCLSEMKVNAKPKPTTDMGALRQLANQSARHAIDVAATKQSREQATLRLTGAAVVMGCGALAAIMAPTVFGLQLVAGIAGVAGGGWFGVRTLRACQMASQEDEMVAAAKGEPTA